MYLTRYSILVVLFSLFLFSCRSIEYERSVDYSDDLSVLCEVDKAKEKLKKAEVLEALSIAKNLIVNRQDIEQVAQLYTEALHSAKVALNAEIEKGDIEKAILILSSILVCEPQFCDVDMARLQGELQASLHNKHPILSSYLSSSSNVFKSSYFCSASIASTIEEAIDATITVFVDRGIKVEKGLGYSDVVLGSGFFIDEYGYIITNYHVIQSEVDPKYEGYSKLYIKNLNGSKEKIPAKVIGYDPLLDLALLKASVKPKYILQLGSSKNLKVGSKIYAIGSPLGLERTITSGIVSSTNRKLLPLVDVIQLDAAINHGSSGGPIVNAEKKDVEAIVFAGVTRTQGLNFAIPVEVLKSILPSLYKGGERSHAWLSGFGKDVSDDVENVEGCPVHQGVMASYIMPQGSLAKTYLVENAVITHLNDVRIEDMASLKMMMLDKKVGQIVKVRAQLLEGDVWREKQYYPLLQKRPQFPAGQIHKKDTLKRSLLPFFGINLEYSGSRRYYRVKDVIPNSYGDEAGFTKNDYMEIRHITFNADSGAVEALFYVKKLKTAYIESFLGATTYADNPGYF